MAKTNATPRTWRAQPTAGHDIHGQTAVYDEATGKDIAIVYDGDAHADLIAAAPELLEACQDLLEYAVILSAEYLDNFASWPNNKAIQGWPKERWLKALDASRKARAAIAAALAH
jgi:hypothetical protein